RFDVLVLDTPPSRNALDFLDAPDRLTGFLEGRALRVFLAPPGLAAKVVGRGTSVVFSVLKRLTGVDLLDDLSVFFRALGGLVDGFKERAAGVKGRLAADATTFIVIPAPEREPVEEAIFFTGKLHDHGMPFGGLVVNRVHPLDGGPPQADVRALTEAPAPLARARTRPASDPPPRRTGEQDPIVIPQLDGDVHDVDGLVAIHAHL